MKKLKLMLCCLLFLVLCVSVLPVNAAAAQRHPGSLTWSLEDGHLRISCRGDMVFNSQPPWHDVQEQITSIELLPGVTSVGYYAFSGCVNLTTVHIPSSLQIICPGAFNFCNELKEVHITDLEAWCRMEILDNPLSYGAGLYLNGEPVVDLVIPQWISQIREGTFEGCTTLERVHIPAGVKFIGYSAFQDCPNLTSVTIDEGLTGISRNAFFGCSNLLRINLPASLKAVDDGAFNGCSTLLSLSYNGTREQFDQIRVDPTNILLLTRIYPTKGVDMVKVKDNWLSSLGSLAIEVIVVLIALRIDYKRKYRI